jgi:hypothetical protein
LSFQPKVALKALDIFAQRNALGNGVIDYSRPERAI